MLLGVLGSFAFAFASWRGSEGSSCVIYRSVPARALNTFFNCYWGLKIGSPEDPQIKEVNAHDRQAHQTSVLSVQALNHRESWIHCCSGIIQ